MTQGIKLSSKRRALLNQLLKKKGVKITDARTPPEQGMITGEIPLTPSQTWFFGNGFAEPHWWNMSLAFKVNRTQIKSELLEQAVWHILSHHDALRARFECDESGWKQVIASPDEIASPFRYMDLSALPKEERNRAADLAKTEVQKSMNLSKGPMMRVVLLDLGTMRNQLVIITHHLVADAFSFGIVIEDIFTVYQQLSEGKQVQLSPKTTPLKAWVERTQEYVQSPEFEQQLSKWLALPWAQTAPLPVDHPDGKAKNTMASTGIVWTSLSADETAALLKDVPEAYGAQVVEALLMALVDSIAGWTAKPWVTINMIKSGRTERIPGTEHMDLTRTVGWLAMGEVLLLEHRKANHPGDALESIKEQLRDLRGEGMLLYMARLSKQYGKKGRFPDHVEELSFNYIGKNAQPAVGIGGVQSAPLFAGSPRSDACHANTLLGCAGAISGNRLILSWEYGKNVYDLATVEKIAASFMASLRALIAHCQSVSRQNSMQNIFK